MNKKQFDSELRRAQTFERIDDEGAYWHFYQRGMRRAFYGERFGSEQEHTACLKERGYRDGMQLVYLFQQQEKSDEE